MNADRDARSGQAVIAPVRHEVVVNAAQERAFRVFTDDFGRWWPKNHTIASFPVDRAIIEPWVGGRCFDRGADGSECDWGRVLAWEPPARLVLAWQVDGTWSYEPDVANASRVTVSFAALGPQTRVTLVHDQFERHLNAGPDLADGVRDGWGTALGLFADAAQSEAAPAAEPWAAPAEPPPAKYVLSYESVPDFRPLAQQHYPAHFARLMAFHERGDLLMVGVLLDPVNGDAMAVFGSQEAAEEFVAEDPFVLNKVVASWSIRPWQEIFYRHDNGRQMSGRAEPGFVFMVFHYPEPGRAEALAQDMREMGAHLAGQPGLIEVDPPWWDERHQALVGISRWTSEAEFRAVMQVGSDASVPEGERQPRQRFYLTSDQLAALR